MIRPQRLELAWQEPQALAHQLTHAYGEEGLVWLDGDGSSLGRWATLAVAPQEIVRCRGLPGEPGASNPFEALRGLAPGHWCGWLSYEAAAWVEPGNPWASDGMATLWIARHDPVLRFDLQKRRLWIEASSTAALERLTQQLACSTEQPKGKPPSIPLKAWHHHTSADQYAAGVQRIRELIAEGDLFQANLTACCSTAWPQVGSALELFLTLRQACPAPFAGLIISDQNEALLSSSPERFLQVSAEGAVQTRPIKGTRPRDGDPEQDAHLAAELVCSDKDRAENVMIVDLLRNDLGKVAKPGTVTVPKLFDIESFPAVHHLVSTVQSELAEGKTATDQLEAAFPGGSITGAPKIRAMEIIEELEPHRRSVYCGSIGYISACGKMDTSITIRTLVCSEDKIHCWAGGGIVADSKAALEYQETLDKVNKILPILSNS